MKFPLAVQLPSAAFARSLNSQWRQYFALCLRTTHPKVFWAQVPPLVQSLARAAFLFKAYTEVRFVRLFERWIFPHRKRKALLIGIRAEADENNVTLMGPHNDVQAMKGLLTKIYGYNEEDITIMLDGGAAEDLSMEPTHQNILREIDNLVKDAHYGDRFVFHFSGHSIQLPNRTGTEDDGLDEAIVPSDNGYIIDNILRQRLVDPLPVGSNLVAIFDTCHSASLLDLKHYRCNRVYLPWVTRVQSSMRIYEHRIRQSPSTYDSCASNSSTQTNRSTSTAASESIPAVKHTQTRKTILKVQRVDAPKPTHTRTRVSILTQLGDVSGLPIPGKSRMTTEMQYVRECEFGSGFSEDDEGGLGTIREESEDHGHSPREGSEEILEPEFQRSSSPEPSPALRCDGFDMCEADTEGEFAHVISLGACKDGQTTWESDCGKSMTATLVDRLEHDPHPCLKILMREISESTYETINKMHEAWLEYKKATMGGNAPSVDEDGGDEQRLSTEDDEMCGKDPLEEWQDPQVASHKKLDMDLPFTL